MINEDTAPAGDDSLQDASGGFAILAGALISGTIQAGFDGLKIDKDTTRQLAKLDEIDALNKNTDAIEDLTKTVAKLTSPQSSKDDAH